MKAGETALVGAGAVGIAVASALLEADVPLRVLARGDRAARLRAGGLGRCGLFGEHRAPPGSFAVDTTTEAWRDRPIERVLVCTKTTASTEVAASLAPLADRGPSGSIAPALVLFHNGWGSAEVFAGLWPRERVFNARVITGFRLADATTSEITVHADAVHLGSLFGADASELAPLAEALSRGGLPTSVTPHIGRDLWAKLLYNCALNPLGALCDLPYGAMAAQAGARSVIEAIVDEVFAVMRAAGHETWWPDSASYLRAFHEEILPPTGAHESSMLLDLRAGRATEIDALSGAVARLGEEHGVPTPVNAALTALVHAAETRRAVGGGRRPA